MRLLSLIWTLVIVGFILLMLIVSVQLRSWWLTGFLTFVLCAGIYLGLQDNRRG